MRFFKKLRDAVVMKKETGYHLVNNVSEAEKVCCECEYSNNKCSSCSHRLMRGKSISYKGVCDHFALDIKFKR